MQYPISNGCIKLSIDGQAEPQLFTKFLLQLLVRELHNRMASPPEEGVTKDERDAEYNIIISDSTLRKILPPQLKNMTDK